MTATQERLHPAAYGTALLILVAVGRLPELFPVLHSFSMGKVAVLAALGSALAAPGADVWKTKSGKHVGLFGLLAIASVGVSIWGGKSLEFLTGPFLGNVILFYVIVRSCRSLATVRFYIACLLLAGGMLSFLTIRLYQTGRASVSDTYDPNDLALVLIAILPLAVVSFFIGNWKEKALCGMVATACLVAIFLTGSRGGFLGFMATVAYLAYSRLPSRTRLELPRISPVKLAAICLGFLLLSSAAPQSTWNRLATLQNLEADYNNTAQTGRISIWKRGLASMIARPYGAGIAAFPAVDGAYGGRYKAAHNQLIQVGTELGLLGLVLFLLFFWSSFKRLRRMDHEILAFAEDDPQTARDYYAFRAFSIGCRAALVGYFVSGFFLSSAYFSLLYAILGLIEGLSFAYEQQLATEPQGDLADLRLPHDIEIMPRPRWDYVHA